MDSRSKRTTRAEWSHAWLHTLHRFLPPYHIRLDDGVSPVVEAPRRVPHSLHTCLKNKLSDMEAMGIISRIDVPLDWVYKLVIIEKKDVFVVVPWPLQVKYGSETWTSPDADHRWWGVSQLGRKKFSIFDQKDSFWQVVLDSDNASAVSAVFVSMTWSVWCPCWWRLYSLWGGGGVTTRMRTKSWSGGDPLPHAFHTPGRIEETSWTFARHFLVQTTRRHSTVTSREPSQDSDHQRHNLHTNLKHLPKNPHNNLHLTSSPQSLQTFQSLYHKRSNASTSSPRTPSRFPHLTTITVGTPKGSLSCKIVPAD